MKSRHLGALLGLIAFASIGLSAGCSDDGGDSGNNNQAGTTGTAGTGGSGGSGGAAVANDCDDEASCKEKYGSKNGAEPPAPPSDGPPSGDDVIHAVSKLFVGESDRSGNVDSNAWKEIGFDIDGWSSTAKQGYHCTPAAGAKANDIRVDGKNGIDNSFGKNIVNGILASLTANPSEQVSSSISEGSFSLVLKIEKLGDAANGTGIKTQLFAVAGTKDGDKYKAPGDDWSSYQWHPFPEVLNGDGTSKVSFPDSYINNNIWVSGSKNTVSLQLSISGFDLKLDINKAQLAVDLSDRKNGTNGTIGGVLATEQLVDGLKKIAGSFDTKFCSDVTALDGILDSVRQASDILQDGTQDPSKECNGISIGLAFDTKVSGLGEAAPASESKDPCAKDE